MGHDPWPGTQTGGCSRRRTAAVGGFATHTPRGATTHWQGEAPRAAHAVLARGRGRLGKLVSKQR